MIKHILRRLLSPPVIVSALIVIAPWAAPVKGEEQQAGAINFAVQHAAERLEMTVNTSRILTLDEKIWKAQVNNGEVLEQTPLSPTQVQVFAKKAGVTQVNLFTEDNRVFTVDVIVYGDAQELAALLQAQFPNASLKVVPVGSNVLISGFVDEPAHAELVARIAEEYYPKVINNMTVSGVQQVVLHVKVMEVSRTKLRALGFDFSKITGNDLVISGASGLIGGMATVLGAPGASDLTETYAMGSSGGENMVLRVVDGSSAFFGVLEALRQDDLMKVLAEPALVTVSGRPARFLSGGEFPILVPQSLGTTSIEFKTFGTELNFVPIVLGNNRIRLEIRPRVSERDFSQGVTTGSITVPGLRTREVETGVEMDAGQTLAIAGLVQTRVEAQNKGLPLVSEVPYLGMLFRRVEEQRNEVELLIMVTPELVEAMDAHEVPQCGPGLRTTSPDDFELFLQGHLEVPNCCPPGCDPGWGGGGPCGTMMPEGGVISEPPGEGVIIEQTQRDVEVRQANVGGTARSHNRYTPSKLPQGATESRAADENVRPVFFGPIGYDVLE